LVSTLTALHVVFNVSMMASWLHIERSLHDLSRILEPYGSFCFWTMFDLTRLVPCPALVFSFWLSNWWEAGDYPASSNLYNSSKVKTNISLTIDLDALSLNETLVDNLARMMGNKQPMVEDIELRSFLNISRLRKVGEGL